MNRYRLWAVGLVGLFVLLTTLLAQEASAHPKDEYVQNTYIDLAPDSTTLQIDLTPGVLVAPQVIALIDTDGDGEISEAEGEAYADAVVQDIVLEADGQPQPLTLVGSSFPSPLDMSAGMGTIRLQVAAEAPSGSPGDHWLYYRNDHQPVNSKYLVNAFKKTGEVEISHQDRDELQHGTRVDYAVTPAALAASEPDETSADAQESGSVSERVQQILKGLIAYVA